MISRLFLAIGFLLFAVILTSFDFHQPSVPNAKNIQQAMTKVNESLYVCKYEVSNKEYGNFLESLRIGNSSLAENYRIDSTKWSNDPMAKYYHRHPAYSNYPVVNISYEGAVAYCEWLSDLYNADPKRKFKKVKFFIPSEEEWMIVAGGGNKNKMYPWSNYYLRNKAGQFLCNFRHLGDESITYDEATKQYDVVPEFQSPGGLGDMGVYTAAVNSFEPVAPYDIHNMSGNVAEMISE